MLVGAFVAVGSNVNGLFMSSAHAADVSPLFDTRMQSGAKILPVMRAKTSGAWIIGQDDFLKDSFTVRNEDEINIDTDQQIYTGSIIKLLTFAATMRKIETDQDLVDAGQMKAEDALTLESRINISERAIEISKHRSFEEYMTLREALPLMLSFSLNDVTHSVAERVANNADIPSNITTAKSRDLEEEFVLHHMRPLAQTIGMENTFVVTSTGLPTYADRAGTKPTWSNDVSTPSDIMKLVNYIVENYPSFLQISSVAEIKMPNKRDSYKNSNPLLENSTKDKADKVQSIPTQGVIAGKTGLTDVAYWQAICVTDLSKRGGEGYLAIFTSGNDNQTYALEPKRVFDRAMDLLQDHHHDPDLQVRLEP